VAEGDAGRPRATQLPDARATLKDTRVRPLLQPMRTKFRKAHKGRIKGIATSALRLRRALRAQGARARADHRAPDRGAAARHAPHEALGQVWIGSIRTSRCREALEVRMGSGRHPEYGCSDQARRILFEVERPCATNRAEALTLAAAKLPIKTRFIERIAVRWRAHMKAADLRAMTVDQLDDESAQAQREQFNLASSGRRTSSRIGRGARGASDIARFKTVAARSVAPRSPRLRDSKMPKRMLEASS